MAKEISITIQSKDGIKTNIYEEIIDGGMIGIGKLILEGELIPFKSELEELKDENITLKERLTVIENQEPINDELEKRLTAIEKAFASIPLLQNSLEEV